MARRSGVALAAALAALLPTDAGAQPALLLPADDTATPAEPGRPVTLLQSADQLGWFALDVPHESVVAVRATRLPPGTRMHWFQPDGTVSCATRQVYANRNTAASRPVQQIGALQYADLCARPGRLYVALRHRRQVIDSRPEVTFTIHGYEPGEHDNDRATARRTALGQATAVKFVPQGDIDTFRLDIARPGTLTLSMSGWLGEEADSDRPFVEWFNAGGDFLGSETFALAVQPGTYYASLAASQDHRRPVHTPFTVRFSLAEADAPGEPDDLLASARAVELDQPVQRTFVPAGDIDSFRVTLPAAGKLDCILEPRPAATYAAVFSSDERLLHRGCPAVLDAGSYIVRLGSADAVTAPLSVRFHLTPHRTYQSIPEGDHVRHRWTFPMTRAP